MRLIKLGLGTEWVSGTFGVLFLLYFCLKPEFDHRLLSKIYRNRILNRDWPIQFLLRRCDRKGSRQEIAFDSDQLLMMGINGLSSCRCHFKTQGAYWLLMESLKNKTKSFSFSTVDEFEGILSVIFNLKLKEFIG